MNPQGVLMTFSTFELNDFHISTRFLLFGGVSLQVHNMSICDYLFSKRRKNRKQTEENVSD